MKTPRDRKIGIVYALYFIMAFASVAAIKAPGGSAGHAAGIGLQLLSTAVYAVLVVLLARLLSVVQGGTAATAAGAGLAGCVVQAYGIVTGSLGAMHLALAIFGVFCILLGGLIIGSSFIPRILGVLLVAAGIGWMAFLAPNLGSAPARYIEALGGVAEIAFMLWLVIVGIPESLHKREIERA